MNKEILSKLMELNNKKADEYLAKFADEIKGKISKSKDNDEIFKNLELLEEFVYKAPEQTLDIVRMIIKNKKFKAKEILKGFYGKDYNDLVSRCISLLEKIRYIKLPEVFDILISLYKNKNERIKNESAGVLEKLAKYDFYALKHIGYSVQRKLLDIVLSWKEKKQKDNIEIIKIIGKEFLRPSFEGISMKDYKTMVFHSGPLQPTKFLKKIRRDTINLIVNLYKQVQDIKMKISLLEVLSHTLYFPVHGDYGEKFIEMVTDNVKYLVEEYNKIIFDKKDKIIAETPVVQEVEKQLNRITQRFKTSKAEKLLDRIRRDKFYSLYRLLIGDITTSLRRGESWEKAKEEQEKGIEIEFKKITKGNLNKWRDKLNSIAKYKDVVDEWKQQGFNNFLFRIAKEKPNLAEVILEDALENHKPLRSFAGPFLFGFRQSNNLKIWDRYIEEIINRKDIGLVKNISNSFFYCTDLESVRKRDINLLSQIIEKKRPFRFLKRAKNGELLNLNFSLIKVLIKLYKRDRKQIEALIIKLIKGDKKNSHMYITQLSFPVHRNKVNLSGWDKKNIRFILDKLIELKDLNYEAQILLLAIAKIDFPSAVDVFIRRIKRRDENARREKKWISSNEYNAIPYDFNDKLSEYINNQKGFIKIFESWADKMTKKTSIYNIELAQFLQKVGGSIFDKVLRDIIKKGTKDDFKRAIDLMWGINSPDFNICFEIIKKTDDERIWKRLGGIMFNTGVVSGEYGMAEAYENKIKIIKAYKPRGNQKEIERIKAFKKMIIRELKVAAKREKQRADEELKLRKIEFEG